MFKEGDIIFVKFYDDKELINVPEYWIKHKFNLQKNNKFVIEQKLYESSLIKGLKWRHATEKERNYYNFPNKLDKLLED